MKFGDLRRDLAQVATVASLTDALNKKLVAELTAVGGDEYATIGALAYRYRRLSPMHSNVAGLLFFEVRDCTPPTVACLLPIMAPRSSGVTVTDLNPPAC